MLSQFSRFPFLFQQARDWIISHESNNVFLKLHEKQFKKIIFGCSFSPEYIEEIYKKEGRKISEKETLELLKIIVCKFKIRDIRLGIRWNKVSKYGTDVDISYYKPFLKYCFEQKISVCLNIGPIKTFRWPEQFVPEYILKQLKVVPQKGAYIIPESELARHAFSYLNQLLIILKEEFSEDERKYITVIQPENEPFHRFGMYKWQMSEEYLIKVIWQIKRTFPDASILLNSSETRNLEQIWKLFENLIRQDQTFHNKLISGFNYYYKAPGMHKIPLLKSFDSITRTKLTRKNICRKNVSNSQRIGYKIEVSEAQAEPWPPFFSPGNNSQEFRFMIKRCMDNILDSKKRSVIRLWGMERLAKASYSNKFSSEQQRIIEFIQDVNKISRSSREVT